MPYKPLVLALLLLPPLGGSPLFADDAPAQTTPWPELKPSQGTAHRGEAEKADQKQGDPSQGHGGDL